ncbi:neutral/alkaline non-lysosomal ceramidase N-terminal domain-containing protein [Larkinella insperata]|uniref:Neutral/alkaline non-lysosomal ceramidase N-terminal domain-containing protein n=1 Tax=Larkinella insperata TaxID=332158 RepID=A0ABW3QGT7_9BACT|nr:neutral/alkaline non-lysosomal ceramidase N-terminal domain-containing protein [Larkinella insperata]
MNTFHNPTFEQSAFAGLIGVAQEDITPPIGIYARNWGAATHEVAEGIHRPLMLSCVTFQTTPDAQPLVLIGADLGWWRSSDDEQLLRTAVLKALSLDESRLLFCLSHTHAGPSMSRDDAPKAGGHLVEPYLRLIQERTIQAVQTALAGAQPATLTWAYGTCALAVSRDLPDREQDRYICGMNPGESADNTLLVGRIADQQDRILGTIVNYACHPTTLAWENRLISPDYIGAMREVVEQATHAPCLFLQGASGELSPREQYVGDTRIADTYGRQLGYAVLSTLEAVLPAKTRLSFTGVVESGAPLAIWKKEPYAPSTTLRAERVEVELPLKPLPSLAEIENEWAACQDNVLKERLWRKRGIRKTVGDGEVTKMPLWVWHLGESVLVAQPNEAYSAFQQQLRARFAPKAVAVMNLVNGSTGYLPPENLYDFDLYPVWQTPFAQGSLELLIESAIQITRNLTRHEPLNA